MLIATNCILQSYVDCHFIIKIFKHVNKIKNYI